MSAEYLLFYDGSCGLCRLSVRIILWLQPRARIVPIDASDPQQLARHTRLSPEQAMRSVYLQLPSGHMVHGYEAIVEIVAVLPVLRLLVPLLRTRVAHWLGEACYALVTRYRHEISHALWLDRTPALQVAYVRAR